MRILIVDDEASIRRLCERVLSAAGHEVRTCGSGEEALPLLGEGWDLLVSDVTMPGLVDGNELARLARQAEVGAVALMTGHPSVNSAVAALKDGACDYLLKPFDVDTLLELVRRRAAGLGTAPMISPRRTRAATILFADIRGSTAFAESLPPEEAAARLDAVLACLIDAVRAEGGVVNKLMGDGALAVFGAPLPHADPVGAAVRAARRTRDEVRALGPLRFGYAVNSGLVAVGRFGKGGSAEYGVIGSAVNVAARLQAAAAPDQILVASACAGALAGRYPLGEERVYALKGLSAGVKAAPLL